MGYERLEKSLTDTIKEEQAKLGFRKEAIRLYYPLSSLNHFFDVQEGEEQMLHRLQHLHGEVVGFGVLFALLVDQQYEEFEKIYTLNQQLQLPTSLEQIEITEEQWEESMDRIPEMSDIRHYPYKVTKEMLALAMKQLKEREADR